MHLHIAYHDRAAPNEANTQWLFSNGAIKLKSNPTLCMTGPTGHTAGPTQLTIEPCEEGNPGQSFYFHNETFYPTTLVSQGSYSIGLPKLSATGSTWPGDAVYAFHAMGSWITPCNPLNEAQLITFNQVNGSAGLIQSPQGLCLSGKCLTEKIGCAPVPFVDCDATDTNQLFLFNSTHQSIQHQDSEMCLSLLSGFVSCDLLSRLSPHSTCSSRSLRSPTAPMCTAPRGISSRTALCPTPCQAGVSPATCPRRLPPWLSSTSLAMAS